MILIYVPCKDENEARSISKALLEKKLIACTNFFPIKSMYSWKGKVEEDNETVMIIKTKEENFQKVKEEIKKLHSYDTPAIIKLSTECNAEYSDYMDKVLT
jgi:periplasmic divalent cation tolerance protein